MARGKGVMFGRGSKEGMNAVVSAILILGIMVLAQYVSMRHPMEWDLTKNKKYSLSDLSRKVVGGLTRDVNLWAFVKRDDSQTRDLLHEYEVLSPRVKVHFVDPVSQPGKAAEFGVTMAPTVVAVISPERKEQVVSPDEDRLTNAINRLSLGQERSAYFLTGYGEPDFNGSDPSGYSSLRDELLASGLAPKPLSIPPSKKIPADAALLVDVDPLYPPFPGEEKLISKYIENGGHLLFFCGTRTPKSWFDFLARFGFDIKNNLVLDPRFQLAGFGPEVLVAGVFANHPITRPFAGRTAFLVLPVAHEAGILASPPAGSEPMALVSTSQKGEAFHVKIKDNKIVPLSNKPEQKGSLAVASASVVRQVKGAPGEVVVVGSGMFAQNQWLNVSANRDFTLNTVSWLTQNTNAIAIHPKAAGTQQPFVMDLRSAVWLRILTLIAIPAFGIFLGLNVWFKRRAL